MSEEAVFAVVYGALFVAWFIINRHRHRWCVDGVLDTLGEDIRRIGAAFNDIAREFERAIDRIVHGPAQRQPAVHVSAQEVARLAAERAYLRGDFDIYEYERRAGALLGLEAR